jgi:NAD+ synthase
MTLPEKIAGWIKKQIKIAGKKGVVFGLSGGIDSAVLGALCKNALGDNVLALMLPCETDPEDLRLALKVSKKFKISTKEISLDDIFKSCVRLYPEAAHLAKANLKPRLRMAALYYFANASDYLVAGAGNKSELAIGYFTKYGDGGVDLLPLGNLLKTEVKKLAGELGVPREVIDRPPSAGLWKGQTDEGEIGISYDELDRTIAAIENKKTEGVNKETLAKVKKMMKASEHKRCNAPIWRREK